MTFLFLLDILLRGLTSTFMIPLGKQSIYLEFRRNQLAVSVKIKPAAVFREDYPNLSSESNQSSDEVSPGVSNAHAEDAML